MIPLPHLRRPTFSEVLALMGRPPLKGTMCSCPFHEDRRPSFSVFNGSGGHEIGKCFKGCFCGDVYELFARAYRCDRKTAIRELNQRVGIAVSRFELDRPLHERFLPARKACQRDDRLRPDLALSQGDDRLIVNLSSLRFIPGDALRLARDRGFLRFALYKCRPSWVVTDRSGVLMQARRMDGRLWFKEVKSITVKDSDASHMLGIGEAADADVIHVCEGGPDFLAVHQVMIEADRRGLMPLSTTAATAMLGASMRPRRASLQGIKASRVIIWAHADEAGREAAKRWKRDFWSKGREVIVIAADEVRAGLKDLNALVSAKGGTEAAVSKLEGLCHE